MTFEDSLAHVLAWEGGLKLGIEPKGERVFAGINEAANPNWEGWKLPEKLEHPDEMIKAMVDKFYFRLWLYTNCEKTLLDVDYFDTCVLQGPKLAVKLLQRMHNMLSKELLTVDGVWGNETTFKINQLNMLIKDEDRRRIFRALRITHLTSLVEAAPMYERFAVGWIKRAMGEKP